MWHWGSRLSRRYLFPVAHNFIIKLLFCLSIQRGYTAGHIDFENAFSKRQLEKPVYVEILKHTLSNEEQGRKMVRLRKSLDGLKDAANICKKLLFDTFMECGLKEMDAASCELFVTRRWFGVLLMIWYCSQKTRELLTTYTANTTTGFEWNMLVSRNVSSV